MVPDAAVATTDSPTGTLVISDDLLATCVHCGFCVPQCPTWDLLREENDSPRGRLYLMRAEAEGRVSAGGAFSIHLGRCLGCRACESACPAGVPYGHLLEQARARIPVRGSRHRMTGWLLRLLTEPKFTRWTYGLGRFLRRSGLATIVGTVLPGGSGRALRLLAATRPRLPLPDLAAGSSVAPSGYGEDTYCLLRGCVMEGLFEHVHAAARRVLAASGCREVPAPDQVCCGALHAHAGRMEEAKNLARQNIEVFEAVSGAWIVSDAAGCGAALRDYPAWLEDDPAWRERAVALAARARDVTELLAGLSAPEHSHLEGRVAYDAPCHLHHAQGVQEEPIAVLDSVHGLEVEALPSSERCCGGAGLYNLAEPELAARVLAPKVQEIDRGGFDWVASGNPGCVMYIGAGLHSAGIDTPVVHPVELLDLAWRGASEDLEECPEPGNTTT